MTLKLTRAIYITFLSLTIITPILFSTQNSELFEIPKMFFVYLGASIIFTLTILKFIAQEKIEFPKNILIASLIIFLFSQVISAFFSIDKFTSVFGYPSRLNGGIISLFAYTVIFLGIVINLKKEDAKKLLLAFIISAFAVSLWGIPSHFGKDPNCYVLTGHLTSDCWQKDFNPTLRIFSSLGQPNWLASYLVLALPITLAFILKTKTVFQKSLFSTIFIAQLLAVIFTNSLSGLLGFATSIVIFLALSREKFTKKTLKFVAPIFVVFVLFLSLYGGQLFSRLSSSSSQISTLISSRSIENLEAINTKPTPSFLIRLIVWQGAIEIIKKNPIVGTGPETFAYAYYKSRPLVHNKTTEWNFFYNKAHNEFLNTFANTGFLGGLSYISFLIIVFVFLKRAFKQNSIIAKASFAAIAGYLVSIFFGFSVVSTQLMMFLVIGTNLVLFDQRNLLQIKIPKLKNPVYKNAAQVAVAFIGLFLVFQVSKLYYADILFQNAQEEGLDPQSLNTYQKAINTFPGKNPFYFSKQAYTSAQITARTKDQDLAKILEEKTKNAAQNAILNSPQNFQIIRKAANTYFLLINVDSQNGQKALGLAKSAVSLAPTNPESYLNLAKIQIGLDMETEAKNNLIKALKLKPDYIEAQELLIQIENLGI